MGYIDLGFSLGLVLYFTFLIILTFNKRFREYFYCRLMEGTYLGDSGEYLYFPKEWELEKNDTGKSIIMVLILIGLHILLFIVTLLVFSLVGPILLPFIIIGAVVGSIVYFVVKRKRANILAKKKQLEAEKELSSIADDEQK